MSVSVLSGDCLEILPTLADASIDACVTDPPYHLTSIVKRYSRDNAAPAKIGQTGAYSRHATGFMGKKWDGGDIAFRPDVWREVLRVLKPGGHLLAFGGSRTYHRLACAIEDAGFEIRDQIQWLYGSGFPKSLDVSKAIDKAAGVERTEVIGSKLGRPGMSKDGSNQRSGFDDAFGGEPSGSMCSDIFAPATEAARKWQGFGTALKPAHEPIVLARKPLIGTVAANVLEWGTGALNVDGCRVGDTPPSVPQPAFNSPTGKIYGFKAGEGRNGEMSSASGRWPANVVHDGSEEVVGMFPDSVSTGGDGYKNSMFCGGKTTGGHGLGDSGSAARFFYMAKADKQDRLSSKHPTVKPIDLLAYLCRLVTPPGGTVLDPFAGSGSTGMACMREGFNCVLIEREAEYVADIKRRIAHVSGQDTSLFASAAE